RESAMAPKARQSLYSWRPHPEIHSARQLFETLDQETRGYVTVDQVVADWPGEPDRQQLLLLSGGTGRLAWPDFRAAVRLWRSLPSHRPPRLRRYLLQSCAENSCGTWAALCAAEATCFAAHAVEQTDWAPLVSLGAFGCLLGLVPLDSSSTDPKLDRNDSGPKPMVNLGPSGRFCVYLGASASLGVTLAPAAPLLAATIGDPKSHGHGPLALCALSGVQLAGFSAALYATALGSPEIAFLLRQ
ncbi:unnamed protein product, partial [Effrenium voratum]